MSINHTAGTVQKLIALLSVVTAIVIASFIGTGNAGADTPQLSPSVATSGPAAGQAFIARPAAATTAAAASTPAPVATPTCSPGQVISTPPGPNAVPVCAKFTFNVTNPNSAGCTACEAFFKKLMGSLAWVVLTVAQITMVGGLIMMLASATNGPRMSRAKQLLTVGTCVVVGVGIFTTTFQSMLKAFGITGFTYPTLQPDNSFWPSGTTFVAKVDGFLTWATLSVAAVVFVGGLLLMLVFSWSKNTVKLERARRVLFISGAVVAGLSLYTGLLGDLYTYASSA